jgi:LysR family hydrogen peroxide-inducible transcriptional activator
MSDFLLQLARVFRELPPSLFEPDTGGAQPPAGRPTPRARAA